MNLKKVINITLVLCIIHGCKINSTAIISEKQTENIQTHCEDSVRTWIKHYAAFPDSYIPLSFEKVGVDHSFANGVEVLPLRRYKLEHTFIIRANDSNIKNATLLFELTPDFFIQDVRYKEENEISLLYRIYPPDYKLWKELYGRTFTATDTLQWRNNNRILYYELAEKFAFNRYIHPEGEDIALSDSLARRLNGLYADK